MGHAALIIPFYDKLYGLESTWSPFTYIVWKKAGSPFCRTSTSVLKGWKKVIRFWTTRSWKN